MPMSNAEKQREYRKRLKNNPEKREEIRKKNLERIKKKTKKVKDMTEEEKNEKRKQWRMQKQAQKQKKQAAEKKKSATQNEPNKNPKYNVRLRKLKVNLKKSLSTIEKLNKTISALRKRNYRQKILYDVNIQKKNKEIDKLNCRIEVTESILKAMYKTSTTVKKRHLKNVAVNEARRHKINSKVFVGKCLGIARVRKYKKVSERKSEKISKEISKFYVRNDISVITAGKKECRTIHKDKQQIRYLTDTISNLYKIYKAEGGQHSFTTFYKYKPFFVLSPTARNRNTCLCIKHSNMTYLLKAMISAKLIDRATTLKDLLLRMSCMITSFNCMHGKCPDCINSRIEVHLSEKQEVVKWWWWQAEKHLYIKKDKNSGDDKELHTRKMTKKVITGTVSELIQTSEKEIKLFKKHYFNMKTQQDQYRICMEQLKSHEVLMICDYSENYNTKMSEEVQSMHFGASKQQVSLHCVMVYWQNKCQSICSVSDSLCHEPAAIWAHLLPVIKFIKECTPNTTVLHIFSDGPTSQYRQKKNYYLLNIFTQKFNFDYATWSYTESGHGKGVADGIGGAVKRRLDLQVLYGNDIKNASDVFNNINATMKSIKPFLILVQDIENMKKIIPSDLRPISGNNEVHQIVTTKEENVILHRPLSCFCGSKRGLCSCYLPMIHNLLPLPHPHFTDLAAWDKNISKHIPTEDSLQDANDDVKGVEMLTEENVLCEDLPIVEMCTSSSAVTLRDENISKHIPAEDSLQVAKKYAKCVKILTEKNTFCEDLPIVVNNASPSEGYGDNVLIQLNENACTRKLATYGKYDSSTTGFKRQNENGDLVAKKVKSLLHVSIPTSNDNRTKSDTTPKILENKTFASPSASRPFYNDTKSCSSNKSLKTVVTRFFICYLCNARKFFTKFESVACMVCKRRVCLECSGNQTYVDYICDKCLED